MKLFGKKKEKEEDVEEEEKELKPIRKKRRSEPRLKKKEPPQPWGKKERILVFVVIVLTAGLSAVLGLSAREWKLPGIPRIKFLPPSISFLTNEKVVLEGENKKSLERANMIINDFTENTKDLSGVYGLDVIDLTSGFSFGVNEHETFQAASLIKLPVMAAMYQEQESGNLDLETKYSLKNSDKVTGAGSLQLKPEGFEITYRNLIRMMGKESDNTAFHITRNLLGDNKINLVVAKIGMRNTSLSDNETTPEDVETFFEQLWHGNVLNEEHKNELLDFMTDTQYEAWLTEGVPSDVRVSHKYGREVHVVNDAGIVFANSPYVVVILSKGVIEREADEVFPKLSRVIYEGMVQ
jgi:beta-lactamase class A